MKIYYFLNKTFEDPFFRAILVIIPPIYFGIYHDIFRSYLTTSDMDVVAVYQALRFNDGLPQTHYDHNGYMNFLMISFFLKVVGWINLIEYSALTELVNAKDSENAFAQLVYALRFYSIGLSCIAALIFYKILSKLINHCLFALLGAVLFSASYGLITNALKSRPELLAMIFTLLAFLYAIKSVNEWSLNGRTYLNAFLLGTMVTFAMMTKFQVIFPLFFMPVLIVVMGQDAAIDPFSGNFRYCNDRRMLATLALLASSSPIIILLGMYVHNTFFWSGPYTELAGWYQVPIYLYIAMSLWIYKLKYNLSTEATLTSLILVTCGMLLPVYLYFIHFLEANLVSTANFYDWLRVYTNYDIRYAESPSLAIITKFLEEIPILVKRYVSIKDLIETPYLGMHMVVGFLTLCLFKFRQWKCALIIIVLLLVSVFCEIGFSLRYLAPEYYIYFEGWTIIAIVLGATQIVSVVDKKYVGIFYFTFAIFVFQNMYYHHSPRMVHRQPESNVCGMLPIEVFPFIKKYCD